MSKSLVHNCDLIVFVLVQCINGTCALRKILLLIRKIVCMYSFIHSFILETYIAPLLETSTEMRSLPM